MISRRFMRSDIRKFTHFANSYRCAIHLDQQIFYSTGKEQNREQDGSKEASQVLQILKASMKANGPMSVSEYMKTCLFHPQHGYYTTKKDVLGPKGDFITSPEISSMFGELIGLWCLVEWQLAGSPTDLQICELGPGSGKMADDILKVFSHTISKDSKVSYHFYEISDVMRARQATTVTGEIYTKFPEQAHTHGLTSKRGHQVHWSDDLDTLPHKFTIFVANEFFDVMPVNIYREDNGLWKELKITEESNKENNCSDLTTCLCEISKSEQNRLVQLATQAEKPEARRKHIEIPLETEKFLKSICAVINRNGGRCLLVDYGYFGEKTDTIKGFKKHRIVHFLETPGLTDLTVDVDFYQIDQILKQGKLTTNTFGPVTQQKFLFNMGIKDRAKGLVNQASDVKDKNAVKWALNKLTADGEMGTLFKVFAIAPKVVSEDYFPVGFRENLLETLKKIN